MNENQFVLWLMGYFDGLGDFKDKNLSTNEYNDILHEIKSCLEHVSDGIEEQNENKKILLQESNTSITVSSSKDCNYTIN